MVHHATNHEGETGFPMRGDLFRAGMMSRCGRRLTVVIPRLFDVADPDACIRCIQAPVPDEGRWAGSSEN
jgi:hypothetical protein